MSTTRPSNKAIAEMLDHTAGLLEAQGENPFRVRAYRTAAETLRDTKASVAEMADSGDEQALMELPGVGEGLAALITEFVKSGRSRQLEELQGQMPPEAVFTQVPGIGEELARQVATSLGINSLEELEQAAHDGRLEKVPGFGAKRVQAVKVTLAGMLSRAAQRRRRPGGEAKPDRPDVAMLLDVDAEYRRKAAAGELKQIAPKRFNPSGDAWLPVLNAQRGDWHFTALYSNTAKAHELGTTHDWVVIYYEHGGREQQATVVTESAGELKGKRVVRGRAVENRRYYQQA